MPALPTSTSTKPITAHIACPESDGHRFLVPDESKSFLISCGVDYTKDTEEIGHGPAIDVEQCVEKCAKNDRCTACGWGYIEGDKDDEYRCWMKGRLGGDHVARANWTFAVLEG